MSRFSFLGGTISSSVSCEDWFLSDICGEVPQCADHFSHEESQIKVIYSWSQKLKLSVLELTHVILHLLKAFHTSNYVFTPDAGF